MQEYTDDIMRGETALRRVLAPRGRTLRYFRHPYLHAGDEPEKKRSVASFLNERGYSDGVVTMDNQEWVYATVYARALGRDDGAMMSTVVKGYLSIWRRASRTTRICRRNGSEETFRTYCCCMSMR